MRPSTLAGLAAALVALVVPVGCSDGGNRAAPTTTLRVITPDEASRLADALVKHHDAGGARVDTRVTYGTASFRATGEIDWVHHVGRVTVTARRSDGTAATPFDIAFNPNVTFEQVPGLEAALAARGRPGVGWVERPLDPSTTPIHVLLRLVETASSTVRDNPVLLLQNRVRHVRSDHVDDGGKRVAVEVYDEGRTRLWIGTDDGRVHRIEADLASTGSVATVTFSAFGPRTVKVPAEAEIVPVGEVSDLYQKLVGR